MSRAVNANLQIGRGATGFRKLAKGTMRATVWGMTRAALLASATVALLTFSQTASAESYITLGVGGAETGGELRAQSLEGDALRIGIGQRFGKLALEATISGTDFSDGEQTVYGTTTAAVDLKYHLRLGGPIELYGKGGLNKTWDSDELEGRGLALGVGLQWSFRLPVTSAALWLDYTHVSTELRNNRGELRDGSVGMATIGASIGF